MTHQPECIASQNERDAQRLAYLAKWPNVCQTCNGSGLLTWEENQSPIGSGLYWPETMSELCDKCLGKCPRCGQVLFPDDNESGDQYNEWAEKEAPCPFCGWNWGKNPDDYLPAAWECYCWELEAV